MSGRFWVLQYHCRHEEMRCLVNGTGKAPGVFWHQSFIAITRSHSIASFSELHTVEFRIVFAPADLNTLVQQCTVLQQDLQLPPVLCGTQHSLLFAKFFSTINSLQCIFNARSCHVPRLFELQISFGCHVYILWSRELVLSSQRCTF